MHDPPNSARPFPLSSVLSTYSHAHFKALWYVTAAAAGVEDVGGAPTLHWNGVASGCTGRVSKLAAMGQAGAGGDDQRSGAPLLGREQHRCGSWLLLHLLPGTDINHQLIIC
jgi:hypothetical protein